MKYLFTPLFQQLEDCQHYVHYILAVFDFRNTKFHNLLSSHMYKLQTAWNKKLTFMSENSKRKLPFSNNLFFFFAFINLNGRQAQKDRARLILHSLFHFPNAWKYHGPREDESSSQEHNVFPCGCWDPTWGHHLPMCTSEVEQTLERHGKQTCQKVQPQQKQIKTAIPTTSPVVKVKFNVYTTLNGNNSLVLTQAILKIICYY